jgi:stearoyl-CoA desaturase (delta-9 desaturase)
VFESTTVVNVPTDPESPGSTDAVDVKTVWQQIALALFIAIPFAALVLAVPVLWGWGLGWHEVVIGTAMYVITGHGVTIGFHRFFTHRAFRAKRWVQVALAIAGSMAIQGPVVRWVADHRKHHRFSDHDGDPHSPWQYGRNVTALARGFWHSHLGWLFDMQTSQQKFAADLCKDPVISGISRTFPLWVTVSMLIPPLLGGLWGRSWQSAFWAFFWASLVRVALLHHVTFSVNSICHITGRRQFRTEDESRNVWWLAVPSMGEAWHNFHHAAPSSARHGVGRGQLDTSAMIIRVMEHLRWVQKVRWPDAGFVAKRQVTVLTAVQAETWHLPSR